MSKKLQFNSYFNSVFLVVKKRLSFFKSFSNVYIWRFLVLGVVIVGVLAGLNINGVANRFSKAFKSDNLRSVSFYSKFATSSSEIDDYNVGWWNYGNVFSPAEVDASANSFYFSDINSTFYNGGAYDLIFEDFENSLIDLDVDYENIEEIEEPESPLAGIDAESHTATSTDEIINLKISSSTIEISSSSEEKMEGLLEKNEETEAENLEIKASTTEEEIISLGTDNSLSGYLNTAYAQEESRLPGMFDHATINFSMALSLMTFDANEQPMLQAKENLSNDENLEYKIISTSTYSIEKDGQIASSSFENEVFQDERATSTEENDIESSGDVIEVIEINKNPDNETIEQVEVVNEPLEPLSSSTNIQILHEKYSSSTTLIEQNRETSATTSDIQVEESFDDFSFFDVFMNKESIAKSDSAVTFWYRIKSTSTDSVWYEIATLYEENISNSINGGYFNFDLPKVLSWQDVGNLELKVEGLAENEPNFVFYLDSVWVDVFFKTTDNFETDEEKKSRWNESLELLSDNDNLSIAKDEELRFRYVKNKENVLDGIGDLLGIGGFWKNIDLNVFVVDSKNNRVDIPLTIIFEDNGEFTVRIDDVPDKFKPGKYSLEFEIVDSSGKTEETKKISQDFSWGVLVFNSNKSIYSSLETAFLQVGVLDDVGHTVCDAELELKITPPSGMVTILSTLDSTIERSSECGPETTTSQPDYHAFYETLGTGLYSVKITAKTKNGIKEMYNTFEVRDKTPYDIERIGPSRIFPQAPYQMKLRIQAKHSFRGDIEEVLPENFVVIGSTIKLLNNSQRDIFGADYLYDEYNQEGRKIISWNNVEFLAGDFVEIIYSFDAPDISPAEYLLGPLSLRGEMNDQENYMENGNANLPPTFRGNINFVEGRQWQIASDAVLKRAKTVQLVAGIYNGLATTGSSTNSNNYLPNFKFKLAETGVVIKDAFVVFEAQIEAYSNGNGNYTGYNMYFDTCAAPCASLDAVSGTNRVQQTDTSVLAYNEGESSQVRILMDVSGETQLANYTGDGSEMEAEFAYNISHGSSIASIGNAKAVLYLTYVYDIDSENITNTVSYPLDSTNGTDNGSRQASVSGCTRESTCPIFDYNIEIPEFPGVATSSNRVSQWFQMYDANDSNGGTDLDPNINIQTVNVDSETFHHEAANSGTQGNIPNMIFPDWSGSGFQENSTDQLEYYINSGTNYAVGGEVIETYISSSSALTKTRTVTLPFGVVNNGQDTTLSFKDVSVNFPENGSGTGVVNVKSAYLRIYSHQHNNGAVTVTVSTKVGSNATSSTPLIYNYNGGGTVVKPMFKIVHIIPNTDYTELESANESTSKDVRAIITQSDATFGGVSAELVITYTYIDESDGYLTNVILNGGQSTSAPGTSVNVSTANSVLPEVSGKTILGAGLNASYTNSDSTGGFSAGTVFQLDANMAVSSPTCSNAYYAEPDDTNSYAEMIKDVTSAMNTTDNQTYTACYSDDYSGSATDGAKMNGILNYTYAWINNPPTGDFNSAQYRTDASGIVDISIEVDDPDNNEVRAMLEYEAGATCAFAVPLDPTLDETDSNATADFGDPGILNVNTYQIGIVGEYIVTASGSNSVFFDWDTKSDLNNQEGNYCLRLTANDQILDQTLPATTTVYIDNIKPSAPGTMSMNERTGNSVTLNFGATSTETNFNEYIIYYKVYDGTDPTETDSIFSSTTDINLYDILFNGAATTTVSGLTQKTTYSFAIWSYDQYGNKASSSRVDVYTNDAPIASFNSAVQKTDGSGVVDVSIEVDDANNDDVIRARIDYDSGGSCLFSPSIKPTLDENASNILADYGLPNINNNFVYQIGTTSAYILTSPGSNTVDFDWLGSTDESSADGTYCLRVITNDTFDNQIKVSTTTLTLDNVNPVPTGDLSFGNITTDSVELIYASTSPSTDTNEPSTNAYRIFYKQGTSGVSESDSEIDSSDLDAYDYNSGTSTIVSGLDSDTDYVFNIWSYDSFGNKISATEVTAKTIKTVNIESLTFTNATSTNIAIADEATEWNFRVEASETSGWYVLDNVYLRLGNAFSTTSPISDLEFRWQQSTQNFSEIGTDALSIATLSGNSSSTCAVNNCTLDFKIIFDKDFASTSVPYDAVVHATNDSANYDTLLSSAFYDVRRVFVEQKHYRWRNDDEGE